MNCPEHGVCRDPEWCLQGGPCDAAHGAEPWPLGIICATAMSGLSLAVGVGSAFVTWSLRPLWVCIGGFALAGVFAGVAIVRGIRRKQRALQHRSAEQERVDRQFAALVDEEFRR